MMGTGAKSLLVSRPIDAARGAGRPEQSRRGGDFHRGAEFSVKLPSASTPPAPICRGAESSGLWDSSRWAAAAAISALAVPLLAAPPALGGNLATSCTPADVCTTRPRDPSSCLIPQLCAPLPQATSLASEGVGFEIPSSFPPLSDVELVEYTKHVLPNGMKVFLVEDHEVPVVRGTLLVAGGAQSDPPAQVGLSSVLSAVQRGGGTASLPGEQLDGALEDMGATLEAQSGLKTASFAFSSLVEDSQRVMSILQDVVRKPQLPEAELKLKIRMGLNSIEHRYDSSAAVPRRKMQQLLYGGDSPLSRQTSVAGLQSITVADLKSFRSVWQRPDTAVLGIVGDFNPQEMLETVSSVFGDWQPDSGQPSIPPALPPLMDVERSASSAAAAAGKVYFVDRPGEVEAAVLVAEPGIDISDPDAPALDIASDILNGFGGRLFAKIRSEKALTYSVSGGWETPPGFPGLFTVSGSTEKPAEFITAVDDVLADLMGPRPPTAQEVSIAQRSAANTFVFNFSNKQQQLGRVLVYDILDLPEDYLVQYQSKLMSVTPASVEAAVGRHLHPGRQTKMIAGDARRILPLPDKLGQAERLPLTP